MSCVLSSKPEALLLKLDEAVLEEIHRAGDRSVKQISARLSGRLQHALDRLVRNEKILKQRGQGNERFIVCLRAASSFANPVTGFSLPTRSPTKTDDG
jgi:hypothetical protein